MIIQKHKLTMSNDNVINTYVLFTFIFYLFKMSY